MLKRSIRFSILIAISLFVFFTAAQTLELNLAGILSSTSSSESKETILPEKKKEPAPVVFGIPTDSLEIVEGVVARGENLSGILSDYNISAVTVGELAQKAREVFNVRKINANRNYIILHALDSARTAQYFIYEPNNIEYVIYDLRGDLAVTRVKREMEVVEKAISGEIRHSLYDDLLQAGGSPQLVNTFADIYAWRLDLNRIRKGDKFKLIYEEKIVNGTTIGFGKIKAAFFEHRGEPMYAIAFDEGKGVNYFDQEGKSLKRAFLREPLEYSRISSRFSLKRFHPVQKRNKPHLGTDFAARRGTPIRTVGDGVVLEARYTRGNGYYVKVRHNKTYTTQYLHMSKFAKGIRKGSHVKQGQTIGYVGSTGLATGPHLCYRFWKNGRQVDALKVKLPEADPIRKKNMPEFNTVKEEIVRRMEVLEPGQVEEQKDLIASAKDNKTQGA
ncbi:peptidoglycan DD-metalloendopeptidase family protein [Botryobacter ruber]|uniref:peptidoglycan DD-metalloendopeptidase family protein n=1 Tax=Botryobacter ruber TaxID=2171629 RepID=UPI000E0B2B98|nr:peptidoglycan DD-metalloendopeptidase family protein [Botryobacter ruber]